MSNGNLFFGLTSALAGGITHLPAAESPPTAAGGAQLTAARSELERMRFDVERLMMITEALWMLLKEQSGMSDAVLIKQVAEIDIRDGKLDGRVAASPPRNCPHCNRIMEKRRPFCIYCGKAVATSPFER